MTEADALAFRREQVTITERKTLQPRGNWPARVCLVMIVKDESRVIERCLASCLPWISSAYISCNGDDETPIAAARALATKPHTIERHPWVSYGHNMTEAIECARLVYAPELLLTMDADETIEGTPELSDTAFGGYMTTHLMGDCEWSRMRVMRADLPWVLEGERHELPVCKAPCKVGHVRGALLVNHNDGGNGSLPVEQVRARYAHEAEIFRRELATDPSNARAQFYFAQSLKDAGKVDEAIVEYRKRVTMDGFEEEAWYSQLMIARLYHHNGHPVEATAEYLRAYMIRPTRAEPLVRLAQLHREKGDHLRSEMLARQALAIALVPRTDLLFYERSAYTWRPRYELAIATYWTGRKRESLDLMRECLADPTLPEGERKSLEPWVRDGT